MKNLIKGILFVVLFFVLIGTVGALEVGNISMLQCIVQGGIAIALLYIIFVFNGGGQHE
jgi:hypothetical protein